LRRCAYFEQPIFLNLILSVLFNKIDFFSDELNLDIFYRRSPGMRKSLCIALSSLFLLACASQNTYTKQQKGTAIGAATGAAVGAAVGGASTGKKDRTKGIIIGGLAGAVAGGLVGNQIGAYMDRQEEALRQAMAAATAADQASIQRSQDVLTATFKSDMFFDFDSATLKPGAYAELDRIAKVFNDYPQTMIQVQGHTDSSGPESYNMALSERRANAVRDALVQRGVAQERMTTVGFGESQPVSSSAAMNRRVSLVMTPIPA
jgi:outer membrane protein OmpA-like peptidoglycan-associated protein